MKPHINFENGVWRCSGWKYGMMITTLGLSPVDVFTRWSNA